MCKLYFQNSPAIFWCVCEETYSRKWSDVRYVLEKKLGIIKDDMVKTVLLGFLKDDYKNKITLYDDYELKEDECVLLERHPLQKKTKAWLPFYVVLEFWYKYTLPKKMDQLSYKLSLVQNEHERMKLCMQKTKLMFELPEETNTPHPFLKILLTTYKKCRTVEGVEDIFIKKNLKCDRCLNFCGTHEEKDCPSKLKTRLRDLPPPTGVPKSHRIQIKDSDKLSSVKWIDFDGNMWSPC
jgi:hypothetical protein